MSNLKNITLHDYQIEVKEFIKTHPYCGVFLDMGMGKTLSTLVALMEIQPEGNILVVAPKTIARSTWVDEIHDWEIPVRTESLIVNEKGNDLSKKKRLEKYAAIAASQPAMYFINRELFADLVDYFVDNKLPWPFPTVVIDELQSFKSPKSARFKAGKKIRPQVKRFIGLTGTPAPNGLLDLWSQIYLMDMGKRLGRSQAAYKHTFFDETRYYNGYPIDWEPKCVMPPMPFEDWLNDTYQITPETYMTFSRQDQTAYMDLYRSYAMSPISAKDEIYRRIDDICISMKNTSVAMPDLIMQDVFVTMDEKEKKLYDELKKESVLSFMDGDIVESEVVAANAAVLQAKLIQLASGSLYTDDTTEVDGYRTYKEIHTKKIDMCNYIVENTNSPVLIAYHYKCDAKRLLESIPGAVLFDKTPEMIHDWNNDKIKVMLIQPASAGHGLNLQKGSGHTMIWFTIPWSLEEYEQTNARLYRQGQKNNVTIYRIFTKGTFDTYVAKKIKDKSMTQRDLLDALEKELSK